MSNILEQQHVTKIGKKLAFGFTPTAVLFRPGKFASIKFTNGRSAIATCLNCYNVPCMKFAEHEIVISNFDKYPADRSPTVCAAKAIEIEEGKPVIKAEYCMLCGVCAARCPVGAIALQAGKGACINYDDSPGFVLDEDFSEDAHNRHIMLFTKASKSGTVLNESDSNINEVFLRLYNTWKRVGDRFPNVLARNLLIGAGLGSALGRKGNNHMRMDILLGPPGVNYGVVEVEFGQDAILDAPRDIMDSMAVLISRYGWDREQLIPLVVSDILPNRRSEYWSIIQDIRNVLGIKIGTVTILSLILLNWHRLKLDLINGHPFYADRDTTSYRVSVLEAIFGRKLNLDSSPRPQIDIAK